MPPLKEKNANARSATSSTQAKDKVASPNTSRKRKSVDNNENLDTAPEVPDKKKSKKSPTKDVSQEKTDDSTKAPAPASAPKAKAKSTTTKEKDDATKSTEKPDPKPKAKAKKETKAATTTSEKEKYNIDNIHLPGESEIAVPVYDTCNDIRTKINQHLRTAPKASQASLVREFVKSYPEGRKPAEGISATSFNTFMRKKGPAAGASMPIFYAAYIYFEKLRVKLDKKKTKKREEMEEVWSESGGMDLKADSDVRMWMRKDEKLAVDKYGHMEFVGGF